MKIFVAGAVSSASEHQLEKYAQLKNILVGYADIISPDDISEFREACISKFPDKSKLEIDKMMTDYDLQCVKDSDLIVCDISAQSTGVGIELGVAKENGNNVVFVCERGSYISSMITGVFGKSECFEYDDINDISDKLISIINTIKQNKR